ncbi:T3SS effector HopA1 family protein [Streptomyces sp. Isolate_45]|uniref:T3SS effector HopA1 family protein n=1 Tax=unclassified Streptomyces TaxID=2593676 RepID=UPI002481B5F7|nr:T3SS effector HopA1 family protein [Streptomyces sp. Isolate_45]MDA5284372.1 T3SS effector HopA1 family protein [Streptomyces sp. Isolate_45]
MTTAAAAAPATPAPADALAPALADALARIHLSADGLTATVGPRTIEGESTRELQQRLGAALYEVFHTGRAEADTRPRRMAPRDHGFERELAAAVPHREVRRTGVLLRAPQEPAGGEALVSWDGVRVRVPVDRLTADGPLVPGTGVSSPASPVRPALSPGFFYAMGSREPGFGDELLRVYVHLTDPGRAPRIWGTVLERLEAAGAGYHAKVLSGPADYPRRDALVVYLGGESWGACHTVADAVRDLPGTAPDTSVFAHRLGPAAAVAWEPADPRPGAGGLSFGQHRAAALAEAAVRAASDAGTGAHAAFGGAGIDPGAPYRNLASPDLPAR